MFSSSAQPGSGISSSAQPGSGISSSAQPGSAGPLLAGPSPRKRARAALAEHPAARGLAIGVALVFLTLFLFVPLAAVIGEAFSEGWRAYVAAVREPMTVAALKLTLITAACAVPLNVLFGLAAAWTIAKFRFRGRNLLLTLIDLPFSVSPVISGMAFVLLFGAHGVFGAWLVDHDVKVIFALPGIVLATTFVTAPLVARELIPLLEGQGSDEELAALTLGASGWQTFLRISLPKMRWGLLFGIVLCNARAMGEFGAVSVVSGHIRGRTNTLPLHVEILYNEYQFQAAFAVASILTVLALLTLVAKALLEWRSRDDAPSRAR